LLSPTFHSDRGGQYETLRSVKKCGNESVHSAPNLDDDDLNFKYESIGDGSARIKGLQSSPITHSLPIHEYIDSQREETRERQMGSFDGLTNEAADGGDTHGDHQVNPTENGANSDVVVSQ